MKKTAGFLLVLGLLAAAVLLTVCSCGSDDGRETGTGTPDTSVGSADPDTVADVTEPDSQTFPSTETEIATDNADGTDTPTWPDTETETEDELANQPYPIGELTVFGQPITSFRIVLSDRPEPAESYAANELLKYTEMACGAAPAAADGSEQAYEIVIGRTDRDTAAVKDARENLNQDGYLLIAENNKLYISGKTPRGTLYGVYSFLEDYLGCRFYTSECETVLRTRSVEIPGTLNVTYSPQFLYRNDYAWCAFSPDYSAKRKINGFPSHDLTEEQGGIPYVYAMTPNFVHTLGWLSGQGKTPCLTDESVYETVLANIRTYLNTHEHADILSVSQDDNMQYCNCERCREVYAAHGNVPSATILLFVNRIAEALKDDYPDLMIDTLAYQYSMTPPTGIEVADNVIIRLCTIDCCMAHPMSACSDPDTAAFLEALRDWQKLTDNIYIWYYDCNFNCLNAPLPTLKANLTNIRILADAGVNGVFAEGLDATYHSGEFGELRAYLMSLMLWNPNMSEDEYYREMDGFLKAYYGNAWTEVRAYIDRICDWSMAYGADTSEDGLGTYHPKCLTLTVDNAIPGIARKDHDLADELLSYWTRALELAGDPGSDAYKHTKASWVQMEYYYMHLMNGKLKDTERCKALYQYMKELGVKKDAWNDLPESGVSFRGTPNF